MKRKIIYITLLLLACAGMHSCLDSASNNTTAVSSDATVASFYFAANDSMPGLAEATFTIEDGLDTGRIYNIDSIRFGTRVDSVIPVLAFNATPGAAIIYTDHDTIILSVADTIDFSHNPTRLQVVASDNQTVKWYNIFVHVHQVDPDLFVWEKIADNVFPTAGAEQQLVVLKGSFYLFVNNGIETTLYRSENAKHWAAVDLQGLPANCRVRNIVEANQMLYYADGATLYSSANGTEWAANDFAAESFRLVNMLFAFNDSLWAITQQGENYHLATSKDAQQWRLHEVLPADFPVSDYAALTFQSVSKRPRAMIVGGFAPTGESLNTRWNVEFTQEKGYAWSNFSIEQPNFQSLTGVDVIYYNNRFYLFGGVDADNTIGEYAILESIDEGMHWHVPDSAHNCLPSSYTLRTKPSVVVGSDNAMYIVGGQSRTQVFSDVYRGKLNSIDW